MSDPFAARRAACRTRLSAAGADAVVCVPGTNMAYLSGFRDEQMERLFLLVVPRSGDPSFVAPEMYAGQLARETDVDDVRTWSDGDDPAALASELARERGVASGHLLLDDRMWTACNHRLRETLADATFGLASEVLAPLRVRKDDRELAALRRAARIADETSVALRERGDDVVGTTERELAAELTRRLDERGGDGVAFDPIVGSGPNGADPHHRHAEREIEAGDPVVLDFGTRVDGYPSDQTRTVVFAGEPSERFRRVHRVVREALAAGVDAVEPGVPAADVDAAARAVIEEAGYGDRFVHRTGHGLGLDVHEEPYVVAGNDRPLEPGMVFSVEPGVYLPGEFGVRIEDVVVVTEDGAARLNDSPRGWRLPETP